MLPRVLRGKGVLNAIIRHRNYGKHIAVLHSFRNSSKKIVRRDTCTVIPRRYGAYFSSQSGRSVEEDESLGPSVEDQYVRKTQLEHILLRPGMYVGPNERLPPQPNYILEPSVPYPSEELQRSPSLARDNPLPPQTPFRMVKRDTGIIPALVKVFDEILVNASDNRLRHPTSCSRIDVIVDPGSGERDPFIRIFNDGTGIPVTIHKTENLYVPEMLFGHLLTGSNFNDDDKRVTGGRHGYGAKLTNIFSKRFTVETLDKQRGKYYCQTWSNNMTEASPPEISVVNKDENDPFTCVSFVPDMARLTGDDSVRHISSDDYDFMCRRVVDIAGCTAGKLKVTLNGIDVSIPSFEDYSRLYRSPNSPPVLFHRINPRWKIGVGLSESNSFESVSFVNGMSTHRGGTHVNVLVQQIAKRIEEKVEKVDQQLGAMVSQGMIRRHLFIACDALIENPTFDSQMKEYLTSSPSTYGSSYILTPKFLDALVAPEESGGPGIVEDILRVARSRQQYSMMKELAGKKSKRQLLSIPKLEDAHQAGTQSGWACTLILTEGDSAKALAVAGLEVVGRQRFGVFPLRGKFLNVRHAPVAKLTGNNEVKALCSILGLDFEKKYDTVAERRELRYGRVMLMTDQDMDGSHIKGLVINFFRYFWPALLQPPVDESQDEALENPPFLCSFITPLLKAKRKTGKEELSFFSMAEYNVWRQSIDDNEMKKYRIKYYKGLGTSTPTEAKAYFAAFDDHLRPFRWNSEKDGELLDMVFDKERASDRRDWILSEYDEESSVSIDDEGVAYEDFVNKELVHFSNADNIRSIPSVIDGLKPSQRKVLYACFKKNLKNEMKVAQLTGYCAEQTAYHHGEASLQATIIGMAQDFVGSNNINLLVPSGQFGTRMVGGADAASPRYIYTYLSPIARYLFPEDDDILLNYCEDDGQRIEPVHFCPIIPLLLVNGSQGIGTGWSTLIPPHKPHDVVDYIRAKIDKLELMPHIRPYAKGFQGEIHQDQSGYRTVGNARVNSSNTVIIDELPLRCWTSTYKDHLLAMRNKGDIIGFLENHTTSTVSFEVELRPSQLKRFQIAGLQKSFKLESKLATTNMNAFDPDGRIRKFDSANEIADAFFPVRLELYNDRRSVLESELNHEAALLRNKAKFIECVISGEISLINGRKSKAQLSHDLSTMGFLSSESLRSIRDNNAIAKRRGAVEKEDTDGSIENLQSDQYNYLLSMPFSSLTTEKIDELRRDVANKEHDLERIRNTLATDLWRNDLDKLSSML